MGSVFHLKREGKPDKNGNSRGCWRYEDKGTGVRDTLNEKFAGDIKRLRESGVTLPIKKIVDQLIDLQNAGKISDGYTIREYAEIYIKEKTEDFKDKPNKSEKKIKGYVRRTKGFLKHFVEMYGGRRLSEVKASDIRNYYIDRRSKTRKVNGVLQNIQIDSVARELAVIKAMYNHANLYERFKGVNPVSQFGIPFEKKKRKRVLSRAEQGRLLAVCSPELQDIVTLLLNTGCRVNEILSLQWSWIEFERRVINLPDFITKNSTAREVSLNQICISLLRERRFITLQSPFVFPSNKSKSGHLEHPKRAWYKALKEAGITDLRIHDLKRTCGTRLKELKVDSEVVKTILAHSDYRTSEPYIHVKDTVHEATELLGITYFGDKSDEKTA